MRQIASYFLPHVLIVALFAAFCLGAHFFAPVVPDEDHGAYFPAPPSFGVLRSGAERQ